jgi:flavin reductase (DIM6/NTAB) family NADH-FMN oxidoreductase RutF
MPTFLTENLSTPENYKLLISSVMPRPIALVSTLNKDETVNLAPYSSFNLVASNPATICFSIVCKPDGTKKDTLINIENLGFSDQWIQLRANQWVNRDAITNQIYNIQKFAV